MKLGGDNIEALRIACAEASLESGRPNFIIRVEVIVANTRLADGTVDYDLMTLGNEEPVGADGYSKAMHALAGDPNPV